jgi:hypothetical protein
MNFKRTDGRTEAIRGRDLDGRTGVLLEDLTMKGGRHVAKGTRVTFDGSSQRAYLYPCPRTKGSELLCILKLARAAALVALDTPIKPAAEVIDVTLDLIDAEVRYLIGAGVLTRFEPIPIDDTPITLKQALDCEKQRGIPSNATNVRWLGLYVKCDSPDGSACRSARVEQPEEGVRWVREAFAEHEPDDVQGTRVYYRADYPTGECQVRPGVFLTWREASEMPRKFSRFNVASRVRGVEQRDGVWCWVIDYRRA